MGDRERERKKLYKGKEEMNGRQRKRERKKIIQREGGEGWETAKERLKE